jgi:hypothetical protein
VYFSAFFIDRDVIRIAQQIYRTLKFDEYLETPCPSEFTIASNVLFLSVVGPDDDFKLFTQGITAVLAIPDDPFMPALVDSLQTTLGSKKPFYRLTWTARMERTKNPKERYLYTLEADYGKYRSRASRAQSSANLCSPKRRNSKKPTISGSRSISRSTSHNNFTDFDSEAFESDRSEDRYKAEYRLECVSIYLENID